jgi:hypothetical protein
MNNKKQVAKKKECISNFACIWKIYALFPIHDAKFGHNAYTHMTL